MIIKRMKGCLVGNRRLISAARFLSTEPNVEINPKTQAEDVSLELPKTDWLTESLKHRDFFHVSELFNVQDLLLARIHLGHKEGTLNDFMKPYIFGSRLGHLIIDLDRTASDLSRALNFMAHIAMRGGLILFICRSNQHQLLVETAAASCGEYSHTRNWEPGMFTNSEKRYGQLVRLPDLLIFLNTQNDVLSQHEAVAEAAKMLIPIVGIVDTNCDPRLVTYPVAGNDDSHNSIALYSKLFQEAIMRGKKKREELLSS